MEFAELRPKLVDEDLLLAHDALQLLHLAFEDLLRAQQSSGPVGVVNVHLLVLPVVGRLEEDLLGVTLGDGGR